MKNCQEKLRSVFISLIFDFVLLLPDIAVALLANSITLYADVLKCTNEILATFLSWLTLRKIARGKITQYNYGFGKFENLTSIIVAGAMAVSVCVVLFTAMERLQDPVEIHAGGASMGILMMFAGVCVNSWLWVKNRRVAVKDNSPIMEAQAHLFKTKAISDGVVLMALSLSVLFKAHAWSAYIDPVASFLIAGFILLAIYEVISHSVYDLLDRTLDESLQLIIVKQLAAFFDDYENIHGIRSRRSGGSTYIEIFLEFDGERKMSQVQEAIDTMKSAIEGNIKGSFVTIAPSTGRVTP